MLSLAIKPETAQPSLEYGRVTAMEGACFIVAGAFGECRAETAVSCLTAPRVGDEVLTALNGLRGCYILSVLTRGDGALKGTDITFDGPLRLHVENGPMSFLAEEGIALATPQQITMTSEKMQLRAKRADVTVERLSVLGSYLHSRIKEMKIVSGRVEEIVQRLTQRLTDTFRFVKDHEEVQTGSSRYLVEKTLTMHAKNTMHVAEEMVTINAEQINLG